MSKETKPGGLQLRGLPLNGRTAALRALLLVDQGMNAQQALAAVLDAPAARHEGAPLSGQDKALCTELVYGCLRTEIRLRYILSSVLSKPQGLPPAMRTVLALAVYGLLFQDKVPAHAVLHEAVDQVRRLFGQGLARVANGALRSLQRMGEEPLGQAFYVTKPKGKNGLAHGADADGFLGQCVFYSIPLWVGTLWRDAYGEQTALAQMRRAFERPYSALRINPAHLCAKELYAALAAGEVPSPPCGYSLSSAVPPGSFEPIGGSLQEQRALVRPQSVHQQAEIKDISMSRLGEPCASDAVVGKSVPVKIGRWGLAFAPGQMPRAVLGHDLRHWQALGAMSWQSAGSQTALLELGLDNWREPVWDACAGYGGKSMALMEWGVPVGLCTDRSAARLRGLPGQCALLNLPQPVCCLADAARPPVRAWHGHILVDAPCSGLGVLARRPDIRRREPQHLAELEGLQRSILKALAEYLQPGRELAYITCTLNPAENDQAVACILKSHKNLRLVRQWQTSHEHSWLEGMYGAVLRNEG
ncbi:MAG: transcription antitermination factor NusB [Desulfovibrio sp.]|uniref:transcription antitermination factor NusB n=1 Tax=Desulfovibrio sp. TaxID=885 RepID=UPI002A360E9D|nr:transcription antitermination factor NusB [Desulfovibrio sp.]MDY0259080.1 transcription antitermination factor NusB [Desulfovibrio sp.]